MIATRSARAQLLSRRFEERQRQASLQRRLNDMDPERHARSMAALQEAVGASSDRLVAIQAELDGAAITVVPNDREPMSAQQARDTARARLRHLDLVVQRHAPASCESIARRLRRAIHTELERLETEQRGPSCD